MKKSSILDEKLKFSVCVQGRYIVGVSSAFKLPHTAPPIYLNSDLKGPLTAGVREANSLFHIHSIQEPHNQSLLLDLGRDLPLIEFLVNQEI